MIRNNQRRRAATSALAAPLNSVQMNQVKQLISATIEHKAFAATTSSITVPTSGVVTRMSGIPSGPGRLQRVGDQVTLKKITFRYLIQVGATGLIAAADQYNTVRVILFRWNEDDGAAAPVTSNVLNGSVSSNVTLWNFNYDDRQLYHVLYDKTHVVFNTPVWNGSAVTWSHGVGGTFVSPNTISMPLASKIEFDFDAIPGTGHIYSLLISDSAFAPNPTCELVTEIEYLDG